MRKRPDSARSLKPVYLQFKDDTRDPRAKTRYVQVLSAQTGGELGVIKWFRSWRRYAFFPNPDTVWDPSCLQAVIDEIARLHAHRDGERQLATALQQIPAGSTTG